jgi:hypothetical protein
MPEQSSAASLVILNLLVSSSKVAILINIKHARPDGWPRRYVQ